MNTYAAMTEKQECRTPDSYSPRSLTMSESLASLTDNRPGFAREASLIDAIRYKDENAPIQRVRVKLGWGGEYEKIPSGDKAGIETVTMKIDELIALLPGLAVPLREEILTERMDKCPADILRILYYFCGEDQPTLLSGFSPFFLTRLRFEAVRSAKREVLVLLINKLKRQLEENIDVRQYESLHERIEQIVRWQGSKEWNTSVDPNGLYEIVFQEIMAVITLVRQYPDDIALRSFFINTLLPSLGRLQLPFEMLIRFPQSVFSFLKKQQKPPQLPPKPSVVELSMQPVESLLQLPPRILFRLPVRVLNDLPVKELVKFPLEFFRMIPLQEFILFSKEVLSCLPVELLLEFPPQEVAKLPEEVDIGFPKAYFQRLELEDLLLFPPKLLVQLDPVIILKISPERLLRFPPMEFARLGIGVLSQFPLEKFDEIPVEMFGLFSQEVCSGLAGMIGKLDRDKQESIARHISAPIPSTGAVPSCRVFLADKANESILPSRDFLETLSGGVNIVRSASLTIGFLNSVLIEVEKNAQKGRLKVYRGMSVTEAIAIMRIFNGGGLRQVEAFIREQSIFNAVQVMDRRTVGSLHLSDNLMVFGKHFGEFEQAKDYARGKGGGLEVLLEFTLKNNAKTILFSKCVFAVPSGFTPEGYMQAEKAEGRMAGYIGSKLERVKEKETYSLCLTNADSWLLFQLLVDSVRVMHISGLPD